MQLLTGSNIRYSSYFFTFTEAFGHGVIGIYSFKVTGDDGITTVSERLESSDPVLEKLNSLQIATSILTSEPSKSSLTDILVNRPSTSSDAVIVDPKVLMELYTTYQEWQEQQAHTFNKRQEEVENKIEIVNALAVKLLQTYTSSFTAMKTTSSHLWGVHELQVEVGELKGRLTEVISNCDGVCKRIVAEGPESLQSSIKPFTAASTTTSFSSTTSLIL
ncbi:uncharacterized protein LOC111894866 isoform X1 [Lactuca sativa]|uniref:uncharacterized protein LOC111894866 isoform X1 n=1 Tax=Lactuca sativa TaxID=4236 RepID=UPI000CC0C1AB|nr:uncharacterized protein LOC111894866 isoform X1 [Lactuca sativa]XP_042757373.1 uncharacterized protein LOC111894866 isoform X1 [Lactuca sativa]XP_052626580.1 uncharacterized protein LOC111894866 isoform X1 [Lactuca sativa]